MQRVFVLGKNKERLSPCTPARARKLLSKNKAAVFRQFPFTIILKERETGNTQPLYFKIDQGSKTTGISLVSINKNSNKVIYACNLVHRGHAISESLTKRRAIRSSRRSRKTRYRKPKWTNTMSKKQFEHINKRPKGWLAPSIKSRLDNTVNLFNKLNKLTPITNVSIENVRFDMQKINNPTISEIGYQQGDLFGFEVKEYLLYQHKHTCAYCHGLSKDPILEIEHILCKSKGGTNRLSNLSLACRKCNQDKGSLLPEEWLQKLSKSKSALNKKRFTLFSKVLKGVKPSLKDAAALNSIRNALINSFNLPIELGSGGLTKYNRKQNNYPKEHWIDAACIGLSGEEIHIPTSLIPVEIKANGRGSRQMCRVDKNGFPRTSAKKASNKFNFKTGDIVIAKVKKGKKQGTYLGRVAVRESGYFNITKKSGVVQGISYQYCRLLHKNDGYSYSNLVNLITT